jgi:hypothetical protein
MSTAQWSTVASVRPRIRPPSSSTVTDALCASASATSSDEVTTVSSSLGDPLGDQPRCESLVQVDGLGAVQQIGCRLRSGASRQVDLAAVFDGDSNAAVSSGTAPP